MSMRGQRTAASPAAVQQLRADLATARIQERQRSTGAAQASSLPDAVVGGGAASGPHSIIKNDDKIVGVLIDGKVYLHTKHDGKRPGTLFGAIHALVGQAAVRARDEEAAFAEDADAGGGLVLSLSIGPASSSPRSMRMSVRAREGGATTTVEPLGRLEWALP